MSPRGRSVVVGVAGRFAVGNAYHADGVGATLVHVERAALDALLRVRAVLTVEGAPWIRPPALQ